MATEVLHGKEGNYPSEMCLKESVRNDNRPVRNVSEEDIQKLEAVEGQDMSCFKFTNLEHVGNLKKLSKEKTKSRALTGKFTMYCIRRYIIES